MKAITLISFLALAVVVSARPDHQYTNKFDSVNLNEILRNRRLLIPYVKCLLAQGKCTAEGKELRSHIKDALENGCAKCSSFQRSASRQVIGHLINKEQMYWNQLVAKYDPSRKFVAKYESDLRTVKA